MGSPSHEINPATEQFGRRKCVTVERKEETLLAFVYHCVQLQLKPLRKYLCIISDHRPPRMDFPGWRDVYYRYQTQHQ